MYVCISVLLLSLACLNYSRYILYVYIYTHIISMRVVYMFQIQTPRRALQLWNCWAHWAIKFKTLSLPTRPSIPAKYYIYRRLYSISVYQMHQICLVAPNSWSLIHSTGASSKSLFFVVQGWDTPKSNDLNMFKLPIFSISTATNWWKNSAKSMQITHFWRKSHEVFVCVSLWIFS